MKKIFEIPEVVYISLTSEAIMGDGSVEMGGGAESGGFGE